MVDVFGNTKITGIARGLVVICAGLMCATPAAQADELADLVARADNAFRSKTTAAVFDMEIKAKSYSRSYKVVSWDDQRKRESALIKILGPASWRGYGTLKVGKQLKLYNPKTNHVSVVNSSMLGDSWMGSHFSNDDLVRETELASDYHLKLAKKWQGESPFGGQATFYRVSMTPRPTAPVAWGRIDYELFASGDLVLPWRATYYRKAKDRKPSRTMTFDSFGKLGGRSLPRRMTVTITDKPGEYTRIEYKKLKFDVKIPKAKFTEQSLRK